MLEDNLLTDESLNTLSKLIEDNMCPELSEIWLSRSSCVFLLWIGNYINQETGQLFLDYCTEHRIMVELGGCPNFSFAPLLPPSQPPFLAYRVISKAEQSGSDLYSCLHFDDIRTANQWSSDHAKPIIGIQLFFYGMGKMAVKMLDTTGTSFISTGECGELVVSKSLSPIVSMEFGYKNSSYRLVGMTNSSDGIVIEVKLCLVVHSWDVCWIRFGLRYRFSAMMAHSTDNVIKITFNNGTCRYWNGDLCWRIPSSVLQSEVAIITSREEAVQVGLELVGNRPFIRIDGDILSLEELKRYRKSVIVNAFVPYCANIVEAVVSILV